MSEDQKGIDRIIQWRAHADQGDFVPALLICYLNWLDEILDKSPKWCIGGLKFPHAGQAFAIERESIDKKAGKYFKDIAYGITSRTPEQADAQPVMETNRPHWSIEKAVTISLTGTTMKTAAG